MNLFRITLFLAAAAITNGAGTTSSINGHKWIAPKATDLRSPCPGLNMHADSQAACFIQANANALTASRTMVIFLGTERAFLSR
ncbi:hypothetical protein B0H19DRAFT_921148 [Mycena capillaripes]|nr:hypothetical protein B0H19DRAFT_921148 [Mycena capillaripes]